MIYIILLVNYFINKSRQQKFGKVVARSSIEPLPFSQIRVSQKGQNKGLAVSDTLGRYFFLTSDGTYELNVKSNSLSGVSLQKNQLAKAVKGILNGDIAL